VLVVVSATGESAIQIDVAWDIENYTDATARQYLIDTYHWAIHGGSFDGRKTIKGNNAANILTTTFVLAPSATTVIKSLKLEVRVYPINKSLRLIVSALVFILVFPSVKSVITT
jgi:hypothetical protein